MFGVLFHSLSGKNGWSYLKLNKIDVAKVIKMSCNERLFCIFDRDHPYTLTIKYDQPDSRTTASPVIGSGGFQTVIHDEYVPNQLITKRYKSKNDVMKEIDDINKKKELLQKKINELFKIDQ